MSKRDSKEVPVSFYDVAAYFSQEEWKLLHEWQKDLYKNVMKEIQQAFISLGPLIATAVFSLKDTDNGVQCPVEYQPSRRRHVINHPKRRSATHTHNSVRKDESPEIFIDHLGVEVGESSIDPSSGHVVNTPDAPFLVKEEEGHDIIDHQGSKRGRDTSTHTVVTIRIKEEDELCSLEKLSDGEESFSRTRGDPGVKSVFSQSLAKKRRIHFQDEPEPQTITTGDESISNERLVGLASVSNENNQASKALPGTVKEKLPQTFEQETPSSSQLWPESNLELGEKSAVNCEIGFVNPAQTNSHQGLQRTESSEVYMDCKNNKNIFIGLPNSPKDSQPYAYYDTEKTATLKHQFTREVIAHTFGDTEIDFERPYSCTECEKRFRQKGSLIEHLRTHTGQRPFRCTDCEKSFSRKRSLIVHRTIHSGVRPYQCSGCEKSFSLKHNLTSHQRICRH